MADSGSLDLSWEAADSDGRPFDATGLPSGVYLYRLRVGDSVETKRMVVVQ
ncbi:MAG: T9SS type A sorting domain-containing protein [Rhodothermales bacterium]|nr:T9SS type A sorting domain-containing protein [Rhodothermales bacterium]